jgi:hypothetical protein
MLINYYFDETSEMKPFTFHAMANPGTTPPRNATREKPPLYDEEKQAFPKGFWVIWNGSGWETTEDHRGESGYLDGVPTEIKEVGPLPEGWSETPPPPTAEEVKAQKIAALQAELSALDQKSMRSIRAIGVLEDDDPDKAQEKYLLAIIEDKVKAIRAALAALKG